jgi:hypothetical protein
MFMQTYMPMQPEKIDRSITQVTSVAYYTYCFLPIVDLTAEARGDCTIGYTNYLLTCHASKVLQQDGLKFTWKKKVVATDTTDILFKEISELPNVEKEGISFNREGRRSTLYFESLEKAHSGIYVCTYTRRKRVFCCKQRTKPKPSEPIPVNPKPGKLQSLFYVGGRKLAWNVVSR